jgi:hypothetical protein
MTGEIQLLVCGEDPQPGRRPSRSTSARNAVSNWRTSRVTSCITAGGRCSASSTTTRPVALQRAPTEDVNMPVAKVEHAHPIRLKDKTSREASAADETSTGPLGKTRTQAGSQKKRMFWSPSVVEILSGRGVRP